LYVIRLPFEIGEIPIFFSCIKIDRGEMNMKRRAVVSVVGKDQVGIIAKVTTILSENHVNILDISQTILQEFFTMMMLVDVSEIESLDLLQGQFDQISDDLGLKINIQLEEIFQSMHRI
jgi:ACT domain-containing protein